MTPPQPHPDATPAPARQPDLRAAAAALLRRYSPPDAEQARLRARFLAHLDARPDALSRFCKPAHITASAIVADADRRRVLLTLHPKVGAWLQLGGHCEPGDDDLRAAALREAVEESGMAGLAVGDAPVDLDAHVVRCMPDGTSAEHLDVRFVVTAPPGAEPRISDESLDLAWWPISALPSPLGASVARLVDRL